jgi:hypothetical protein
MSDELAAAYMFGARWAKDDIDREHYREMNRLRDLKRQTDYQIMGAEAKEKAVTKILEATIAEISPGGRANKVFSDPSKRKVHVEVFVEQAEKELSRMSDGKLVFVNADAARKMKTLEAAVMTLRRVH